MCAVRKESTGNAMLMWSPLMPFVFFLEFFAKVDTADLRSSDSGSAPYLPPSPL